MEYVKQKIQNEKNKKFDRRIRLNVSGTIFDTWMGTLEHVPGTRLALLAQLKESDESWDSERGEYFFDRHAGVFAPIIHYYRTGELHVDQNICGNIIKEELEFWGLTELDIEPCCWGHYSQFKDHKETLAALDDNFTIQIDIDAWGDSPSNMQKFKRRMWQFLEEPSSSRSAKIFAVVSMLFVVLSISIFCLETYESFRVPIAGAIAKNVSRSTLILSPVGEYCIRSRPDHPIYDFYDSEPHAAMKYLDYICAAYFTLEMIVRFYFSPKKMIFIRQPMTIIDLLCLVPHLIAIILVTIDPNDTTSQLFKSMLVLRIVRILRIFKLMKHYSAFKILVYTIKVSTKELLLLVVFLFTGVLIFASLIFHVEMETFPNIPQGIWWAIVTMTTVGYGDKVPTTTAGYVIGCFCVLCGVLTVAFTVPIVVNNFALYYAHAQSRIKLPVNKRKELKRKLFLKSKKSLEFIEKLKNRRNKHHSSDFAMLDIIHTPRDPPCGQEDDQKYNASVVKQPPKTVYIECNSHNNEPEDINMNKQEKIHTISESVLSNIHPVSPGSVGMTEEEQHKMETKQLLSDLNDANRRIKEERKRQLGILNMKREQKIMQLNESNTNPRKAMSEEAGPHTSSWLFLVQ